MDSEAHIDQTAPWQRTRRQTDSDSCTAASRTAGALPESQGPGYHPPPGTEASCPRLPLSGSIQYFCLALKHQGVTVYKKVLLSFRRHYRRPGYHNFLIVRNLPCGGMHGPTIRAEHSASSAQPSLGPSVDHVISFLYEFLCSRGQ